LDIQKILSFIFPQTNSTNDEGVLEKIYN